MQKIQSFSCLVSVRYEGAIESVFANCMVDHNGIFLMVPLKHFPRAIEKQAAKVKVISLRPQDVYNSGHPEFDLKYRYMLNLDAPELRTD